jgi:hypothetical protein
VFVLAGRAPGGLLYIFHEIYCPLFGADFATPVWPPRICAHIYLTDFNVRNNGD